MLMHGFEVIMSEVAMGSDPDERPQTNHSDSQIDARHVSLEYEVDGRNVLAVKDVSFAVRKSEFYCILGPSGCGKTTLLNILAGLLTPSSGEILIDGAAIGARKQDRGVVFQDIGQLFPWRTARFNVEFGLEMRGIKKAEREKTALEFLRLVGLEKFVDAYPHQLSGGMQQRVAIARSLAYNPQVLLMDEPFAALDAMTRDDMQQLLSRVWAQTKKTVVYITHNVSEAVFLADRVLIMNAHPGSVKIEIPVNLQRPRDPLGTSFVEMQREIMGHLKKF